jgi:putative transposase
MYHFWQRNSLPFVLNNEETFIQKLNYIHNNPLQERWGLAETPEKYHYSSAKFYTTGVDEFKFLTHWQDR